MGAADRGHGRSKKTGTERTSVVASKGATFREESIRRNSSESFDSASPKPMPVDRLRG